MPGLLSGVGISDAQREKNSRAHRPGVVLAVLGVLAVYLYLFSSLPLRTSLPTPADLAQRLGITSPLILDTDGNVRAAMPASFTYPHASLPASGMPSNDDELLFVFLAIGAAFLTVYFVPLRYKRTSLVFWTLVCLVFLFGVRPTCGLVYGHLLVYLTLHPRRQRPEPWSGATAVLGYLAFGPHAPWTGAGMLGMAASAAGGMAIYRFGFLRALEWPRVAGALRTTVVQSAMLTVLIGAVLSALTGMQFRLVLGVLLFFWQWERLMMYHADYKDDLVPKDLRFRDYLSVFLSPGGVVSWNWGVDIGQGYAYTTNNFLARDKNALALEGLKIWCIALLYLTFRDWAIYFVHGLFGSLGINVYHADMLSMACHFNEGGAVGTPSVLITTILDRLGWLALWGGIVHFKVGVWRVCGYHMDPYFNKPWAATNLVNFWARYTFHYREFLVRCFYYPVFFRFFKRHTRTRVLVATLAAAGFGNLTWGHISERGFYFGIDAPGVLWELGTWPYFFSLGLGIGIVQLYLLRKNEKRSPRRPWTFDRRLPLDILSAYATLQFFSLITLFRRGCDDATLWDQARLILIGVGIRL